MNGHTEATNKQQQTNINKQTNKQTTLEQRANSNQHATRDGMFNNAKKTMSHFKTWCAVRHSVGTCETTGPKSIGIPQSPMPSLPTVDRVVAVELPHLGEPAVDPGPEHRAAHVCGPVLGVRERGLRRAARVDEDERRREDRRVTFIIIFLYFMGAGGNTRSL